MELPFDYDKAFSRNIGWFTETEQALLKTKRVAIAGLGGVGGLHLIALTRLGIQNFTLSDFDRFDIENFNRQTGAKCSTLGQKKLDAVIDMALDINPDLNIRRFPDGVSNDNVDAFLDGADLYVDGLDFFALDARAAVFRHCEQRGIPAITAAPLGMGTAVINFLPGQMSFEDYFGLQGHQGEELYLRFFIGLSPARLAQPYLVDPSRTNLAAKKGPSTTIGCELCAGAAAGQAVKILLQRGKIYAAPWSLHFDAYRNRFKKCYRPFGAKNPLQQLSLIIGRQFLKRKAHPLPEQQPQPDTPAKQVLEQAKWAPSGDNTQPWRFRLDSQTRFRIYANDTRDWVVYDLKGHASQMAVGALLESIEIAAAGLGYRAQIEKAAESLEQTPIFDVELQATEQPDKKSALAPFLKVRTVQRKPMSTRAISDECWATLQQALPDGYTLMTKARLGERWGMAKLMFNNAKVRLTIPEAYAVHSKIIEWGAQFSDTKIPDQALGTNPAMLKIMPWLMASWDRIALFNKYFAGTLAPRIELDLIPGLFCAGHVALVAEQRPTTPDDYIAAGRAMQRFWLSATAQGLSIQPEMTPLIFDQYIRQNTSFTTVEAANRQSAACSMQLRSLLGNDVTDRALFLCRIGYSSIPASRSTRPPLEQLLVNVDDKTGSSEPTRT